MSFNSPKPIRGLDALSEIYILINEKGSSIADVWDGTNLKMTFRRTVSEHLMNLWEELLAIASSISFSEEKDSLIWELNSQGVYSVQTLYAIVSVRGIKQVYTPMMWKLRVPPRIHVFLWLLANNKLLTRDKTCFFCSEHESVHHIMFDCCVAKLI